MVSGFPSPKMVLKVVFLWSLFVALGSLTSFGEARQLVEKSKVGGKIENREKFVEFSEIKEKNDLGGVKTSLPFPNFPFVPPLPQIPQLPFPFPFPFPLPPSIPKLPFPFPPFPFPIPPISFPFPPSIPKLPIPLPPIIPGVPPLPNCPLAPAKE